jgi:hypothetical protein
VTTSEINDLRMLLTWILIFSPLLVGVVDAASPWTLEDYPNPTASAASNKCGPQMLDRVCDPDIVIAKDEERLEVQHVIHGIEHELPHACGGEKVEGYQVAVALARSIDGGKEAAGPMARGLHDAWAVGHGACNDGTVLLLSIEDRQAFVSTGAGVKLIVTDDHVEVRADNSCLQAC